LGFLSARRKSNTLAIAGGFSASVLLLYQEYFLIIIPALALSTIRWTGSNSAERIDQENGSPSSALTSKVSSEIRNFLDLLRSARKSPGEARSSCVRFCLWLLTAVVIGSALFCWYNNVRFGSPFDSGKFRFSSQRGIPTFGNPVAGFGTLMLSPGKSVFLYSPTVILALMGIRRLYQQQRALAVGVCLASVALVLFLSCISFAGGDWCWGPRYLGVVVALLSLAVPFAWASFSRARIVPIVIALSFAIQVMAVSVENTRFFLELGLNDAFWVEDPWFYFKHSALLARPAETLSLIDPPPLQADYFNALRDPEYCTYTVLGPPGTVPRSKAPTWITHFKIFYLPKPWPLWMSWIPPESRPINLQIWLLGMGGLLLMALTVLNPLYERPIWRKLAEVEGVGREADAL
jgi:hypothetical protein